MSGLGSALLAWAVEALVASALLMLVVLAIRRPVARAFGATAAYALWALPVLRLALPPLPAAWREGVAAPLTPLAEVGQQVTVLIVPAGGDAAFAFPGAGTVMAWLWVAGAAVFLAWHVLSYRRFSRRILRDAVAIDRIGGVTIVASAAAPGPLAFGVARRFVAFPHDFAGRYDDRERALALAHELGHHARGDLVANWIALAVLALHWFDPVAWVAFRAYRADQELANDARVLAGRDATERHAYACAIVKSAHGGAVAAACHLHNVRDLKGRLRMIAAHRGSAPRLIAGMVTVAGVMVAGLGLTASGTSAAEQVRERVTAITSPPSLSSTPSPSAEGVPVDQPRRTHRIVIVKDGNRLVYEGAAADAYAAANPPPAAPLPPQVPETPAVPVPPAPPMPGDVKVVVRDGTGAIRSEAFGGMYRPSDVPQVESMACPSGSDERLVLDDRHAGRRRIVICTDRVAAIGERARASALAQVDAARIRRDADRRALAGLRAARAAMSGKRDMADWERDEVLRSIDRSIAQVERGRDEH